MSAIDPNAHFDPEAPSELPDDGDPGEHGRVGYGRYARYTPLGLALLLVAGLLAIGIYRSNANDGPSMPESRVGEMKGKPAPAVTLTLLDGNTVNLADLRGQVVVLNFWATWCAPCRDELPILQQVAAIGPVNGVDFSILGVAVKATNPEDAVRSWVAELGLTFPTGIDAGGDSPRMGPIEAAFGGADFLPLTIVIDPNGVVHTVRLGPYKDVDSVFRDITDAA